MTLRAACKELDELEKAPNLERFRQVYKKLLSAYPALEGFWIRWAHTEFRMTNECQRSIDIFESALEKIPFSLLLWVNYLKFCLTFSQLTDSEIDSLFIRAEKAIGDHFLSHEFWDLKLERTNDNMSELVTLLETKTLHQFTKYYQLLVTYLESSRSLNDLRGFNSLIPEIDFVNTNESEDLDNIKNTILSKLQLRYDLHFDRVHNAMVFERQLKRPFFHPKHNNELKHWLNYMENTPNKVKILERALIPFYNDSKLWTQYIRELQQQNKDVDGIYKIPDLPDLNDRFEMWQKRNENIKTIFNEEKTLIDLIDGELKHSQYAEYIFN